MCANYSTFFAIKKYKTKTLVFHSASQSSFKKEIVNKAIQLIKMGLGEQLQFIQILCMWLKPFRISEIC